MSASHKTPALNSQGPDHWASQTFLVTVEYRGTERGAEVNGAVRQSFGIYEAVDGTRVIHLATGTRMATAHTGMRARELAEALESILKWEEVRIQKDEVGLRYPTGISHPCLDRAAQVIERFGSLPCDAMFTNVYAEEIFKAADVYPLMSTEQVALVLFVIALAAIIWATCIGKMIEGSL